MTNQPDQPIDVEVFRAGDYGPKGVYTSDDLRRVAEDYDPTHHEAPVTLDHRQQGPADGWVRSLRCVGDLLVATLDRLSPRLAEALRNQRYKKRSIELYRRFQATDRPYLKAVSFLGAASPEVKGLADPTFSEVDCFEEAIPPSTAHLVMAAKERLIRHQSWDPRWEEQGLTEIFEALASTDRLESFLCFLEQLPTPVEFTAESDAAAAVRRTSAGAIHRHEEALEALRRDPTLRYRDLLLGDNHEHHS